MHPLCSTPRHEWRLIHDYSLDLDCFLLTLDSGAEARAGFLEVAAIRERACIGVEGFQYEAGSLAKEECFEVESLNRERQMFEIVTETSDPPEQCRAFLSVDTFFTVSDCECFELR